MKPCSTTARRIEVSRFTRILIPQEETNPCNFISLLGALLAVGVGKEIPYELTFNMDMTSLQLSPKKGSVFVTDDAVALLREHGRSPAFIKGSALDRWVHVMPIISASGEYLCVFVVIRDKSFAVSKLSKVRKKHFY